MGTAEFFFLVNPRNINILRNNLMPWPIVVASVNNKGEFPAIGRIYVCVQIWKIGLNNTRL